MENNIAKLEQDAINFKTTEHIINVRNFINDIIIDLLERAKLHDKSKLQQPELDFFVTHTHRLAGLTYGSDEYKKCLQEIKPALDHHYAKNRHHPEHHKNGIGDMTLIDLIEMLADWKAATLRHNDGNIKKSIEINGERFGINSQLVKILENTVKEMGW